MQQTSAVDRALLLTVSRFQGVVDEEGQPYILHCLRVMMSFSDPVLQQVAVMHDLVEDTPVTLDDLRQAGFATEVVEAVGLLTRQAETSYAEYVLRLKANPLALRSSWPTCDNACLSRALYRPARRSGPTSPGPLSAELSVPGDRIDEAEYRDRMAALK